MVRYGAQRSRMATLAATTAAVLLLVLCCMAALGAEALSFRSPDSATGEMYSSRTALPPLPRSTLRFPLRRSGPASRKLVARAMANRPGYKRMLEANAHGARMNALAVQEKKKRLRTASSDGRPMSPLASPGADGKLTASSRGPGVAPLAGCPFADFTIPMTIGAATFELLVDTGSATLALAGSSCTTCVAGGVSPLWAANHDSRDQNAVTQGTYGDNTGWRGEIWMDSVALADASGHNVSLPARMRIVVITSQSTSGRDADGTPDPNANPFFVVDSCSDQVETFEKAIVSQGIVGLAFQGLATSGTDSFASALYAQHPEMPQVFSMQMCEGSGNLWWGGLPPAAATATGASTGTDVGFMEGEVLYTPLYGSTFFTVAPSDIYIDGVSLSLGPRDFPIVSGSSNAVDSGTTMWELPSAAYVRVVTALIRDANFKKYFRWDARDNFFAHGKSECERAMHNGRVVSFQQLQRELPTITVQFTNGLSVTMDGVGSYLLPCNKEYDQWTPGIIGSPSGFLGGWPFMNQFITVHDVANMRMGFAPTKNCEVGQTTLNANVTMGAPHPQHIEPTPDEGISAATTTTTGATATPIAAILIASALALLSITATR